MTFTGGHCIVFIHCSEVVKGVHFERFSLQLQNTFDVLVSAIRASKFLPGNTGIQDLFFRLHLAGTVGAEHCGQVPGGVSHLVFRGVFYFSCRVPGALLRRPLSAVAENRQGMGRACPLQAVGNPRVLCVKFAGITLINCGKEYIPARKPC